MRSRNVLAVPVLLIASMVYGAGPQPVAVHNFVCVGGEGLGECPRGGVPTSIIQGSDGNFYGTASETIQLPEQAGGLIFSLTPSGKFTILFKFLPGSGQNFPDGQDPVQLVEGSDGMLYGATDLGGANDIGTVFRLNRDGSDFQVLHSFCDNCSNGYDPLGMAVGADGAVYGSAFYSGNPECDCGAIYRVDTATGDYRLITQTNGPPSSPVAGNNGMLYWTVRGDLFIYNESAGKVQRVVLKLPKGPDNFPGTAGDLVFGANGNLYGIYGVLEEGSGVFEIQPNGTGLVLFPKIPNFVQGNTSGLVLGGDGNLWMELSGAQAGAGVIESFSPSDGKVLQTLTPFSQTSKVGEYPDDLISGQDGRLWGVTMNYGQTPNNRTSAEGVVFSLEPNP
jgi:uncharacterized repeat protein (TIGR03803 family)